jgi:hypothetical protein
VLGIKFHQLPRNNLHKRRCWIAAINRKNWTPGDATRVCGRHFLSGKPSDDPENVDYCPSKFMKGNSLSATSVLKTIKHKEREVRHQNRVVKKYERASLIEMAEVIGYIFFIVVLVLMFCTMFL